MIFLSVIALIFLFMAFMKGKEVGKREGREEILKEDLARVDRDFSRVDRDLEYLMKRHNAVSFKSKF